MSIFRLIVLTIVIALVSVSGAHTQPKPPDPLCDPNPKPIQRFFPDRNNLTKCDQGWFAYNNSDTIVIFVHGILSNSRDAWFHDAAAAKDNRYWPDMVRTDPRFRYPSIYLAGYYTEVLSGIYDIRAAANDLVTRLDARDADGRRVLDKKNILFVGHSTGGLVIRHMLTRMWNVDRFNDKAIGIALVASPAIGSKHATLLKRIAAVFGLNVEDENKMASQLAWQNGFLAELDKDFRTIKDFKTTDHPNGLLPFMTGIEMIENHFFVKGMPQLVTPDSAARYFGEGEIIAGSNHWTIAKPFDPEKPPHLTLVNFFREPFQVKVAAAAAVPPRVKIVLMDSFTKGKIYEPNPKHGEMNSHVIQRKLAGLPIDVSDIEPVYFNWAGDEAIAAKNPDLLIIHYSSWATGGIRNSEARDRLISFLKKALTPQTKTKALVYSRIGKNDGNFDIGADIRRSLPANVRSRVYGFPVRAHSKRYSTFEDEATATQLREAITKILDLKQ